MKFHPASAKMTVTTKCERVQPVAAGVDENGELIWEGQQMPRWQMEMFRTFLDWAGSRFARWSEVFHYQENDREFRADDSLLPDESKSLTKQSIDKRKAQYHTGKRWRRVVIGD